MIHPTQGIPVERPVLGDASGPLAMTQVLRRTYALVLAGGRGVRLQQLTADRAKPAVPFGGTLNIIDFTLSNCINSGIRHIGILTQYKAQSLIRHIERGWGFLAANLGEFIDVVPAQQQVGEHWYSGTANAVYQNLAMIQAAGAEYVLVLAGDHIYKMDYGRLLTDHLSSAADVTVASVEVPIEEASAFGVLAVDADRRVTRFEEKPARPMPLPGQAGRTLASMGIYVFSCRCLQDALARDAADAASSHDFGRDLLPWLVAHRRVAAHRFQDSCVNRAGHKPYWRDVGTVDAFWAANLDLVQATPELDLYDDQWPIFSLPRQLPPAKFMADERQRAGVAIDSLVSSGCIVCGATVRGSILSTEVRVGEGSEIDDSVILPHAVVGRDVRLRRAVIDSRCILPDGFSAGFDLHKDRQRFHVTERGVTLVTAQMLDPRTG